MYLAVLKYSGQNQLEEDRNDWAYTSRSQLPLGLQKPGSRTRDPETMEECCLLGSVLACFILFSQGPEA